MKKFFGIIFCAAIIFCQNFASAAENLIEASGSYVMDSRLDETPASATARAREEAKRAATEKAGVYLQSYTKIVNLTLDADEVRTVAAKILKIQRENSKIEVVEENLLKFTVEIEALVDDADNSEILKNILADKKNLEESVRRNEELQKEYDALKAEMAELKKNFAAADVEEQISLKKIAAQNSKYFQAAQELERGNEFYDEKNFSAAKFAYENALALNKNFSAALNNLGNVQIQLGNFQNALENFEQAKKISPNKAEIYNNSGTAQYFLKNYSAAIENYSKAIDLNPNYAEAFYNRAAANYALKNFSAAMPDAERALDLNPNDSETKNLCELIRKNLKN